MRRRAFLGTVVSGGGLTGGCLSSGDGDTPAGGRGSNGTPTGILSATPTQTERPTPAAAEESATASTDTATEMEADAGPETATEQAAPLQIEQANLVWSVQGSDPLDRNHIDAVGAGARVRLAVGLSVGFDDEARSEHVFEGRIYNDEGRQIDAFEQAFDPQDVPPDASPWYAMPIDTAGFSRGTFTVEVSVTDVRQNVTAGPTTVAFDVVEPLEDDDVELREYSPETVTAGREFTWEVTLRNLTDRTSSIDGTLTVSVRGEGSSAVGPQSYTIPAGSMVTYRRDELRLPEPGTYVFRLSPYGLSWEIEATADGTPSTPS